MHPTVTCDDGIVVGRDDLLDAVLRYHDFVVSPQLSVLKVLTFVVLEFTGDGVEEVSENFGVLTVVVNPISITVWAGAINLPMMLGIWRTGTYSSLDFWSSCIRLRISATMFVFPGIW